MCPQIVAFGRRTRLSAWRLQHSAHLLLSVDSFWYSIACITAHAVLLSRHVPRATVRLRVHYAWLAHVDRALSPSSSLSHFLSSLCNLNITAPKPGQSFAGLSARDSNRYLLSVSLLTWLASAFVWGERLSLSPVRSDRRTDMTRNYSYFCSKIFWSNLLAISQAIRHWKQTTPMSPPFSVSSLASLVVGHRISGSVRVPNPYLRFSCLLISI